MTCKGEIELFFDHMNKANWPITIFGAGHVAQALIKILEPMDCSVNCVDSREEWLKMLPQSAKIKPVHSSDYAAVLKTLPQNSFVVIMTYSHESDLEVVKECSKYNFRYTGLLGSKSKKKWMESKLEEAKFPGDVFQKIHCPIGLPIGNNAPAEIAVSISAQLLQERDSFLKDETA